MKTLEENIRESIRAFLLTDHLCDEMPTIDMLNAVFVVLVSVRNQRQEYFNAAIRMKTWLAKYGEHRRDCACTKQLTINCNCGLTELFRIEL